MHCNRHDGWFAINPNRFGGIMRELARPSNWSMSADGFTVGWLDGRVSAYTRHMRSTLALLVLAATTGVAQAQQPTVPAASIGLPLPPIGLPLPIIGLPPASDAIRTSTPAHPTPDGRRHGHRPPAIILFGAPYAFGFEMWQQSATPGVIASSPAPSSTAVVPAPETGTLQLELQPRDAQLFVDGEYVGTWGDLAGELELLPGTHRIEARAPMFEALTFDVRIVAGRTITYRGTLTRVEERRRQEPALPSANTPPRPEPSSRPVPPPIPATFYLIPGCYLGNVPPDQVKLPDGCDLSRIITHTPKR